MNHSLPAVLLWLVVCWPLLLTLPLVRRYIPWPRLLALLPVLLLLLWPGDIALHVSWLFMGTGLAVDTSVRWILALLFIIWSGVYFLDPRSSIASKATATTTFYLLTLSSNLGAVLAADLLTFLIFSTVMGYSFYGLLVQSNEFTFRPVMRLYVLALVVADLLLFEALILIASTGADLHYAAVADAMAMNSSLVVYVWLVLAAFILRAGLWPLHLWQRQLFTALAPSQRLLLIAVPLTTAWLGGLRWLPTSGNAQQESIQMLELFGIAAILYGLIRFMLRPRWQLFLAWFAVVLGGVMILLWADRLAANWWLGPHSRIEFSALVILAGILVLLSIFTPFSKKLPEGKKILPVWFIRVFIDLGGGGQSAWLGVVSLLQSSLRYLEQHFFHWLDELPAMSWHTTISLFVLIGVGLAWLVMV